MLRRFLGAARLDLGIAARHLLLNVMAGSAFVPRPVRRRLYRIAGIEAHTMNIFPGVRITGTDLVLGRDTFVNHGCYLDAARGRIEVGARCHLAPEVMILTATHELASGFASRAERYLTTVVGDDVWLGARTTVLPGVHVGERCVVAAGAVVVEDCTPAGLYAGVPARRVRDLDATHR